MRLDGDLIVHYIHFHRLWFYWLDNSIQKKYSCKGKIEYHKETEMILRNDSVNLISDKTITEREARRILRELFPDKRIMKAYPIHSGYTPEHKGSRK